MIRALKKIVFATLLCINCASCFLFKEEKQIDITTATEISSLEQWAVISNSYAVLLETPGDESTISAHGRQGEIHQIKGSKILVEGKTQTIWYKLDDGWIPQSKIKIYSNILQAQKMSEQLSQ